MSRITELQEKRAGLVTQAREILNRNDKLESEELSQYNGLEGEIVSLGQRIEAEQRQVEREREMAVVAAPVAARKEEPVAEQAQDAAKIERRAAFRKYLAGGTESLGQVERRALQMDLDTAGGFLVAPQEFVADLIRFVNDNVWVRKLATIMSVNNAESLGVPVLANDPADSDWTTEIATGSADTTMSFGKRELRPHPLAKLEKVAAKLLRASSIDVEALVIERLGYKFGITMEKGYLSGTGNSQPLGVFTASADGIDTGRDVSTGNTATALGAANLFEVRYKIKENYWGRAVWIFHRDALKQIMKMTDTNGQYLWVSSGIAQRGLAAGQPDTILGSPVYLSEYAPNTFTTGLYVGIFGDFSRYWIADSLQMQFQRLVELYAATAQVGFIGRAETDGMPVLAEAFARCKLA